MMPTSFITSNSFFTMDYNVFVQTIFHRTFFKMKFTININHAFTNAVE